jgi:RNA polymerase sigma-70 factor (ECF subfamily)
LIYARSTPDPTFGEQLDAARRGEDWAWHHLYTKLIGPITGYLTSRGARHPDDLASETFLHVARNIEQFEGDEESFRSWVFVIAHRRLIDARRTANRRPKIADRAEEDPEGGNVEQEAIDRLGNTSVQALLDQLTEDQREVLALRVVADLSLKETAQVTGRDVGAVKALQRRAIHRLQRVFETGTVTL